LGFFTHRLNPNLIFSNVFDRNYPNILWPERTLQNIALLDLNHFDTSLFVKKKEIKSFHPIF
jgi:hypothetical protein